jgi:hypothetical protein
VKHQTVIFWERFDDLPTGIARGEIIDGIHKNLFAKKIHLRLKKPIFIKKLNHASSI